MRFLLPAWLVLAACGADKPLPPDPLVMARRALDDGLPKRALDHAAAATSGPLLVARLQALIELDEWGTFEKLLRTVPAGAERAALDCLLAAARKDVGAERKCRAEAIEPKVLDATLGDASRRALGRVLETEGRPEEAELELRRLADARPTNANRKALVAYLERQGFVREAVAFLEAWLAERPDDSSLEMKLAQTLERKVRGDLLDKRASEAEAAARRLLALQPERAQIRFFLAEALELKGDKTGAEAERAAAKAAGATPPVPVDSFPGLGAPGADDHPHP
jgi:tetratricopeptide (TPR) repeat protein